MIRFKREISIKQNANETYQLTTDFGQKYEMFKIVSTNERNPITSWWDRNHQSELRQWQKDALIKMLADVLPNVELFLVYRAGQGHSQPHDIAVAKFNNLWVLSTQEHTWIQDSKYSEIKFNIEDSIGSILDKNVREIVFEFREAMRNETTFN